MEETFSEVLRNIEKIVDSIDSVDIMAERMPDANGATERAEKKFYTMMDMMSQLLATLTQIVGGVQNQNTNENNAITSNNSGGNGNGSNHGGTPVGSISRLLQVLFLPKEAPPPELEAPMADEIRERYMEYASLPTKIQNILTLDQFMI